MCNVVLAYISAVDRYVDIPLQDPDCPVLILSDACSALYRFLRGPPCGRGEDGGRERVEACDCASEGFRRRLSLLRGEGAVAMFASVVSPLGIFRHCLRRVSGRS